MRWKLFLLFAFYFVFAAKAFASENQFVTIVNPVRISKYTPNPLESIKAQYRVIRKFDLPATWLLTFDVLDNPDMVRIIKSFDKKQEIGLFFEITPNLAKKSGVIYQDLGSWHFAGSLFLSGYEKEDRLKIIDTQFYKFKEIFGYYPTSVGAWWIDSYSLDYMGRKYGINSNLGLSDQFSTDGYQVWGTYWSNPYYPSKIHSGIPASDNSNKIDVVTLQWAARDPLNGYFNSYFSTQDYLQEPVSQRTGYFEKLVNLYTRKGNNSFGQIVVGLESDLSVDAYEGEFTNQIRVIKELLEKGEVRVLTMTNFSNWYKDTFPLVSPSHIISTDDLLGKPVKVIWWQSPFYRIGIIYNRETSETKVFDFRVYYDNFQEPNYLTPNRERKLSIYIPSYFDQLNLSENVWNLELGKMKTEEKTKENFKLSFEKGNLVFKPDSFLVSNYKGDLPDTLYKNPNVLIKRNSSIIEIVPRKKFIVEEEGFIFRDLTDVATHELMRRKTFVIVTLLFSFFIILCLLIIRSGIHQRVKLIFLSLLIFLLSTGVWFWYRKNSTLYYVSQSEIDALIFLLLQPYGQVLVYDKECLGCRWFTSLKPSVFANKRSYVQRWGKHPIVKNRSVFEAKDQKSARLEFEKTNAKYIYLVKYADYIEKLPFSPGDLNIEKIFENANAEVWRLKEK